MAKIIQEIRRTTKWKTEKRLYDSLEGLEIISEFTFIV